MVKKVAAAITTLGYLINYAVVYAAPRDAEVAFPGAGIDPNERSVGDLISNALRIVFIAAALAVLIFLIIGAFRWITSGGDKEAIGKARGTIVSALVGLAILALAFFIVVIVGQILNIDILSLPEIPTLNDEPTTAF